MVETAVPAQAGRHVAAKPVTPAFPGPAEERKGNQKNRSRGGSSTFPIVMQVLAMIGIGALVYSSAADWFARLGHNAEISGYVQQVENLPAETVEAQWQAAKDYNSHVPAGVLRDPYLSNYAATGEDHGEDAAYIAYKQVLAVSDNGVIGHLTYPALQISLPIYHGTDDEVLRKGVGHLYGSSVPVGGLGTHSVLTSHSGLVHAELFTPLPKANVGDTLQIRVLGETHWYQVDQIQTIRPEDTDKLTVEPGEDRVTLITCTPIGINSHRLLVQAMRIPAPETGDGTQVIPGSGAGIPWWAVVFLSGSAAVGWMLFRPIKPRPNAVVG